MKLSSVNLQRHTQQIFYVLNTFRRQYSRKVRLHLTFENVETQFWVTNFKTTSPQRKNVDDY